MCLLLNYKKYVCVPRSFLVINVRNQRKNLCSPCIYGSEYNFTFYMFKLFYTWKYVFYSIRCVIYRNERCSLLFIVVLCVVRVLKAYWKDGSCS